MRNLLPVLTALLLLPGICRAQETTADLIRKLGSGNYLERERAAKALEERGKAALPSLNNAIENADLETRRRVLLLMERIEERALLAELLRPTPTQIRFQNISLGDALREIEPTIGLRCGNLASKVRIDRIDTGVLPYWQAWGRFCKEAQLEESDNALYAAKLMSMRDGVDEQIKLLLRRDEFDTQGKFALPRIDFTSSPALERYAVDDRHSVRVRVRWLMMDHKLVKAVPHAVFVVEVRPEPRLEIAATPRVELTRLIDDAGKETAIEVARILPAYLNGSEAGYLSAFAGEVQYGGLLHLKAIPWRTPTSKLRALHGNVRVEITVRPSTLELSQLATSVGKTVRSYDGVTVKLLAFDSTDEGDLALRLHVDNIGSLTPQAPEQKFVRVRPGFIAERGAIDVALERLALLNARGQEYRKLKAQYQASKAGKGHDVELVLAAKAGMDEPTLVLTKAPRNIVLMVPFVVRDLAWEEKESAKPQAK
jgi:hypothetical protein